MLPVMELLFQSLIGFKINWNPYHFVAHLLKVSFQSLIGFKINWNMGQNASNNSLNFVSIPNRV